MSTKTPKTPVAEPLMDPANYSSDDANAAPVLIVRQLTRIANTLDRIAVALASATSTTPREKRRIVLKKGRTR